MYEPWLSYEQTLTWTSEEETSTSPQSLHLARIVAIPGPLSLVVVVIVIVGAVLESTGMGQMDHFHTK